MSSECHMSIRHNSLFRLPYDGSDLVIVIQVVDSESGNHRCLIKLSSGASDFTRLIFCSHGKAQNKCCILALIDKNSNKVKIMEITTAGILVISPFE